MLVTRRLNRLFRCFLVVFLGFCGGVFPEVAEAGDGEVSSDGAINFTINVRYAPNSSTFSDIKTAIKSENQRICDATDGQLHYGDVTVETGTSTEDEADFWLYARSGRAYAAIDGIGTLGKHGTIWGDDLDDTFSHEAGHYVFNLGDEYPNKCWTSRGRCIESGDATNHSLMQQSTPGVSRADHNEFCVSDNHDPNQGSINSCPISGACSGCSNSSYVQTSGQEQRHGESCWETLERRYGFVSAPSSTPDPSPPSDCPEPTFQDDLEITDYTMLMLDRSGSMAYPSSGQPGQVEVCSNSADDDGDGTVDESDCVESRHFYLKQSAKAWLDLAADTGMSVGITTFSTGTNVEESFAELKSGSGNNLQQYKQTVDNLSPGNQTAIGKAINTTINEYQGVNNASKAGLLVSDGKETANSNPIQAAQDAEEKDIRLFTISTGGASDRDTLTRVASEASGRRLDSPQVNELVPFFAQTWAKQQNWPLLIPRAEYKVDRGGETEEDEIRDDAWFEDTSSFPPGGVRRNTTQFRVPDKTKALEFIFAGKNDNMKGFDILVSLKDPNGNIVDTDTPGSNWSITHEEGYIHATYEAPKPGVWTMTVHPGKKGGDDLQEGNITVIAVNPLAELFVDTSPRIPKSGQSVEVTVNPMFSTTLNDLDNAQLVAESPDGTKSYFNLTQTAQTFPLGAGETLYTATVPDYIALAGVYDLRVMTQTGGSTWNQPGEPNDDGPSNTVSVPSYLTGRTATFYRPPDSEHELPGGEKKK